MYIYLCYSNVRENQPRDYVSMLQCHNKNHYLPSSFAAYVQPEMSGECGVLIQSYLTNLMSINPATPFCENWLR